MIDDDKNSDKDKNSEYFMKLLEYRESYEECIKTKIKNWIHLYFKKTSNLENNNIQGYIDNLVTVLNYINSKDKNIKMKSTKSTLSLNQFKTSFKLLLERCRKLSAINPL